MNPQEQFQQAQQLFLQSRQLPPERRGPFLDLNCPDAGLRREVEKLLQADEQSDDHFATALPLRDAVRSAGLERTIGPYRVLEKLGEGGFGTVYMAEQRQPVRRTVALKIIKLGMDTSQVIARFEAERQALAMMDHPNIAKVFDAGASESGRPYFVMELVRGLPITTWCDEQKVDIPQRLQLFMQVCSAVQHAHQKGIIHRDLKPSNVLVTMVDNKPVPKVIDFGIAKATAARLTEQTLFTEFHQMIGTPQYMSPEQADISACDIDTRSDVYSLGVLLYELLVGDTPFSARDLRSKAFAEIQRVIREVDPPRPSTRLTERQEAIASVAAVRKIDPSQLTRQLRGELDWIVMKCLEKDRTRRYETAHGLARDLEHYLHDEPVHACPPSLAYRLRKALRRNKGKFVAGSLVAFALIAGIAVSTWQAVRATHAEATAQHLLVEETNERHEAEKQRQLAEHNEQSAKLQRQLAVANLLKARDAVDQMLTRVGQDDLRTIPQMEPVRRKLLEDALRFYQEFLGQQQDDPQIRFECAKAYHRVGWISEELGDFKQAEGSLRAAVSMLEKLIAEQPREPSFRAQLALSISTLGGMSASLYRRDDAAKLTARAGELWKQLAEEFPQNLEYRSSYAWHLVGVAREMTNLNDAEETLQRAITLLQTVPQDRPSLSSDALDAASPHQALADVYMKAGRVKEAEEQLHAAIDVKEGQLAHDPQNPTLRASLAFVQLKLANLLGHAERAKEAEELIRTAISHYTRLANDFPSVPQYRASLVETQLTLCGILVAARQFSQAEDLYQSSLSQAQRLASEVPDRPWYTELLMRHFIEYGRFQQKLNQPQRAAEAYMQALGLGENKKGLEANTANAASKLGYLMDSQKRPAEALQWHRKALDYWRRAGNEADHRVGWSIQDIAILLESQARFAESEQLLFDHLQRLRQLPDCPPDAVAFTMQRLAYLYDGWKKPDEARVWRDKLKKPAASSTQPQTQNSPQH